MICPCTSPSTTHQSRVRQQVLPNSEYKDGTIHITVRTGHDANHPSPINPDPLMHTLGTAMLHYNNPDVQAIAFAQVNSFKADLKKIGDMGSKAAVTELTQLHDYQVYNPVKLASLTPME
jgi:hypothetical protein